MILKIAICFDPAAPDNVTFKQLSDSRIAQSKRVDVECDLSKLLDVESSKLKIEEFRAKGANSLLIASNINNLTSAINLIRANDRKLRLLGSPTLYTSQTLRDGGEAVVGLVLVGPWHPKAYLNSPLAREKNPWKAPVNWRTAMAYDATRAIIAGLQLQQNDIITRDGLQQTLRQSFSTRGSTGQDDVQFTATGSRAALKPVLVKVQQCNSGDDLSECVKDSSERSYRFALERVIE